MRYVGIVGSHQLQPRQTTAAIVLVEALVRMFYDYDSDVVVVSGGAEGIDKMAEMDALAICRNEPLIFLPQNRRWEPHGFKERNIKIEEASDALYCIRSRDSKTYGSGWTADYFDTLGKGKAVRYWV